MSKIAFLGLGAMGSRMAPHLIKVGHDVTVWNRSPAAVAAAVARRARWSHTVHLRRQHSRKKDQNSAPPGGI
jgi:3-hydroxyisobutyrate dehydrogenase